MRSLLSNQHKHRIISVSLIIIMQIVILLIIHFYNNRRNDVTHEFSPDQMFYAADNTPDGEEYDGSNAQIIGSIATGNRRRIVCPSVPVTPGVWQVDVYYSTTTPVNSTTGVHIAAYQEDDLYSVIESESNKLFGDASHRTILVHVYRNTSVIIRAIMDDGCMDDITIQSIKLTHLAKRSIFPILSVLVVLFIICDLVLFDFLIFNKRWMILLQKNRRIVWGLVLLTFFSSLPLFAGKLLTGYDQRFHYYRIYALAEGIRYGDFPVMIYPEYANGYGYPNGIFYPDLLLYIPAILYNIGFRMETAYKMLLFIVNILTVGISFFSFQKLSGKNATASIVGTSLYVMALPRLIATYTRGALGAACAFAFLPLLMTGLYGLFSKETDGNKQYLYISLGMSGILASHVLGSVMAFGFSILYLLFHPRQLFTSRVLKRILMAGMLTFLLSAWFLIPFLFSYMGSDLGLNQELRDIANFAAYPAQLFSNRFNVIGDVRADIQGMYHDMPMTLGIASLMIIISLIVSLYFVKEAKQELRERKILLILFVVSIWMSSTLFPYRWLYFHSPEIYSVLAHFQFAYRFLAPAVGILAVLATITYAKSMYDSPISKKIHMLAIILTTIFVFQGMDTLMRYSDEMPPFEFNNSFRELDFSALYGSEYYPAGFDQGDTPQRLFPQELDAVGGSASIISRNGTHITVHVENPSTDSVALEFPLVFYQGYSAFSSQGKLLVGRGTNSRVRVQIPAQYAGDLTVCFTAPPMWIAAMIISFLTMIVLLFGNVIKLIKASHYNTR